MHFTNQQFEKARQARDSRFDGRFFIGVETTGIYCRPVCPVKMPMSKNVRFFLTAAAATEAGFRPCLRCRPEASPGTPAWMGTSTTVKRALQLIAEGALDDQSIEVLSDRLGVTTRHLSRLFSKHLGASPVAVAQTRRLQFAKKLLDETQLKMTDIALASGYKSVRRFNDHVQKVYGKSPTELRKKKAKHEGAFSLKLGYRQPFDFTSLLSFLSVRAIPGVEFVDATSYSRCMDFDGNVARVTVQDEPEASALKVTVEAVDSSHLFHITRKVKNLFDLDADPDEVNRVLCRDPLLKGLVKEKPGQRVPGHWAPFEIAVRAIVGQQVSVKGATTVMGRIADQYGHRHAQGLSFPGPEQLAGLNIESLSMPKKRAQAIKDLSQQVFDGHLHFGAEMMPEELAEKLQAIKGIGPWTAQYIAMRVLNDPDAFLDGDLVLLKVAERKLGLLNRQQLLEHSEHWRPWRAYAGMHLWRAAANLES